MFGGGGFVKRKALLSTILTVRSVSRKSTVDTGESKPTPPTYPCADPLTQLRDNSGARPPTKPQSNMRAESFHRNVLQQIYFEALSTFYTSYQELLPGGRFVVPIGCFWGPQNLCRPALGGLLWSLERRKSKNKGDQNPLNQRDKQFISLIQGFLSF